MNELNNILLRMRRNPKNVRFKDLCKVCNFYFGSSSQKSGSHIIFRTPWSGDPRINIQNYREKAKAYQVRQVLKAIERLESENGIT